MELLAMTFDEDIKGNSRSSRFAVVDIMNGSVLSDLTLFDFSREDYASGAIFSVDLDNDGQAELCHLTSSGVESYRFYNGRFNLTKTYWGLASTDIAIGKSMFFTDLNADGYLDIVIAPAVLDGAINRSIPRYIAEGGSTRATPVENSWKVFKFTGSSFVDSNFLLPVHGGSDYLFLDVDMDGYPDLVERGRYNRNTSRSGRGSNISIYRNITVR